MQTKLECLIKAVYRRYKAILPKIFLAHPDEETLVCYFEGCLTDKETEAVKRHLLECEICAEAFAVRIGIGVPEDLSIPDSLIAEVKELMIGSMPVLEILLKLKDNLFDLLRTNGDVLVEQEWMPASLVRSRKIKSFKDEITILKDYDDIRLEVKIDSKGKDIFNLNVYVKEKQISRPIKDLRISLLKDDTELESYIVPSGRVRFEDIMPGKYKIEISGIESKMIFFLLDISV